MAYLVQLPGADRMWAVDGSAVVRIPVRQALAMRDPDVQDPQGLSHSQSRALAHRAKVADDGSIDEELRGLVAMHLSDFLNGSAAIFEEFASRR